MKNLKDIPTKALGGYRMLEIYFVRHGKTEWNEKGMLQGKQNSPLTIEGREQAKKLGKALKNIEFDAFYTSPLGRAASTAELIIGDRDQALFTIPEFREMSFGEMEGLPKEEFKRLHPIQHDIIWSDATRYNPKDFKGETFDEVDARIMQGFDHLLKSFPNGGRVLVVSHGMTLKNIFMHVWGHGLEDYWNDPVPDNTSYSIVTYEDGRFNMKEFSNTDHLK